MEESKRGVLAEEKEVSTEGRPNGIRTKGLWPAIPNGMDKRRMNVMTYPKGSVYPKVVNQD